MYCSCLEKLSYSTYSVVTPDPTWFFNHQLLPLLPRSWSEPRGKHLCKWGVCPHSLIGGFDACPYAAVVIRLVENPEMSGCCICLLIAGFLKRNCCTDEYDGGFGLEEAMLTY